jgi:predicted  nucleic acid-binding Zn-ribbon protein
LVDIKANFDAAESDRIARGKLIDQQGELLGTREAEIHRCLAELAELHVQLENVKNERNLAAAQLDDWKSKFQNAEVDRIARGKVIEGQGERLAAREAEIHLRLEELKTLYPQLEALKNERNYLTAELADLRSHLNRAEADRAARGQVIEQQGARIVELEKLLRLAEQNRD